MSDQLPINTFPNISFVADDILNRINDDNNDNNPLGIRKDILEGNADIVTGMLFQAILRVTHVDGDGGFEAEIINSKNPTDHVAVEDELTIHHTVNNAATMIDSIRYKELKSSIRADTIELEELLAKMAAEV